MLTSAILVLALCQATWWDGGVEASISRVPSMRRVWADAIVSLPGSDRAGVAYLLTDLPLSDLTLVKPDELLQNIRLAARARGATQWAKDVPRNIYLEFVLPHACVTEPRDSMRKEFMEKYLPLAKKSKSTGEAALALNKALFADFKVVYNTMRLRTDQSSRESVAQGMATCTGLSIMLIEA
ncbi:MAG: hypothetical protein ABIV13_03640 [Fimbriimonadales bacterium]